MDFMYELKIPKERIAVLIGTEGKIKKWLEEETNSKISVNSEEGFVSISGEDSLMIYSAREVVKAIARGFNPEIAKLLLRTDYVFLPINVLDYTSRSKKSVERLRGRVIGEKGKSRRTIEQLTETYISVYGKTISVIGESERAELSRTAIENLLIGNTHPSVYKWLEKKKKELVRRRVLGTQLRE